MTPFSLKEFVKKNHFRLILALTKNNNIEKKSSESTKSSNNKLSSNSSGLLLDLDEKLRPITGLSLSGGAFKGLGHLGVIRSLIKHNVHIDCVAGTSIGAIIGAIYCSKGNWTVAEWDKVIEKMLDLNLHDLINKPNISISALERDELALQNHDKLEELIRSFIHVDNFNQLSKPLRVVATSLDNGQKKVFAEGNLIEALLASASLPIIYPHVHINGTTYIDGGFSEVIPTEELDAQYIITSNVTSIPFKGLKTLNPLKLFLNRFNQKYWPSVVKSLKRSDFTLFVKQDGHEFSLEHCKKNIRDSYINTENNMPNLIKSIKQKAIKINKKNERYIIKNLFFNNRLH